MTDLEKLKQDIDEGRFTPTYAAPAGCCRWAVFGSDGDEGTLTGRGPRRVFSCLTGEVQRIIPDLVQAWLAEQGLLDDVTARF